MRQGPGLCTSQQDIMLSNADDKSSWHATGPWLVLITAGHNA